MSGLTAVYAAKALLRKSTLRTLRRISEQALNNQSQAVLKQLVEQDFYRNVKRVGCYLSMLKGELQTNGIISDLLERGITLYTPYIPHSNPTPSSSSSSPSFFAPSMRMLRLYSSADLSACPIDKWGILDPSPYRLDTLPPLSTPREDAMSLPSDENLDLILIPGVAFDRDCNRLGRGKAFYDRFLNEYMERCKHEKSEKADRKKKPLLIALALREQMVENVPFTEEDFQLDGVITPDEIIWRK